MNIEIKKLLKKHWKIVVFLILFLLFLITKNILFAILTLISMIAIVGSEVHEGVEKHGWTHEIVDTVISLVLVLVFWFGLQFILSTASPISAIVTCSMLPNLDRGDLVIVQGSEINAYEISMSKEEFEKLKSYETEVEYNGMNFSVKGSIYSYCSENQDPICSSFISEPEKFTEKRGNMVFHYTKCDLKYLEEGKTVSEPCVDYVEYKGKEYPINLSHDTVVYIPEENTYFSYVGDIIHRTYFKINVDGEIYYLAKGDNNQILDIQMYSYQYELGNLPAKKINGKEIIQIPYVGYLKLFISGLFTAPPQCNTNLEYDYLN